MIKGYKCFNKNLINRYGMPFEVGKTYSVDGDIQFGNNGNGFHMCVNLEDTLRYFDGFNTEIDICEVMGDGNFVLFEDNYYGYYDMYSVEKIHIIKKLSRNEIIEMLLNSYEFKVIRFIQGYKLLPEELELFKIKFANNISIIKAISYYQEGNLDVYSKSSHARTRKKNI